MTLFQLIGGFAWRHRREYVSAAVMLVLIALLTVWVPRRVGHLIDGLVAGTLTGAALWQELAILIGMGIAIYLFRVGWRLQLFAAAFRLGVELRTRLYDRLALQGPPFFNRQRTGDLMARATNDVDAVEMAAGEAFLAGFDGTLTLVLVVAMMTLGVDWRLGLVALLPFPLMAWAFFVISRHVHEAWRDSLERFSNLNEHVQETVAAVRTLRALGLEQRAAGDFAQRAKRAADASFDAQRWEARYEPAVGLTLTAAAVLSLGVGGWLFWHEELSVGTLTGLHDVSHAAHLADVRRRLGAVAARTRQGGLGAGSIRCCANRSRWTITANARSPRRGRSWSSACRSRTRRRPPSILAADPGASPAARRPPR